jgi:GT2 family glycosyltransferase
MIQTSIIILSYNTSDLLHQCLSALYTYLPEQAEVIVVDNDSSDGSVEMIKKQFPKVSIVINKENLGFAAGINIGVKKATGTYLLLLNSDAMIQDNGISDMITFLEHDRTIGVLGGLLVNEDGTIQRSYGSFYTLPAVTRMLLVGDKGELIGQTIAKPEAVDWVSGGFMLIRKEIFDTIDGFDGNFFMYIEDMEFCYRVIKHGYKVCIFPSVRVYHVGQGSSNRSFAVQHIYKGLRYFYKKHRKPWEYMIVTLLLIVKAIALIGIGSLTKNDYLVTTYRKALMS